MSNVKVYFHRIDIIDTNNGTELPYDGDTIREMIEHLKEEHGIEQNSYVSIDISPTIEVTSIKPKETLDFFEDDRYILGRLCRKKDNNQIIKRDYDTLLADPVFGPVEEVTRGIEEYSFFLLDTMKGVLLMSSKRGAPTETALANLSDTFGLETKMHFTLIPNRDGIKLLYDSSSPEISKITIEMPVPDAEYLQRVLGIPDGELLDLVRENVTHIDLVLKPEPKNSIFRGRDAVRGAIDHFKSILPNLNKAVVRGKSNSFKMTDFDLREQFFSYTIDITKSHIENGRTVNYSLEEIAGQYKEQLHLAYERNQEFIEHLIER